ncbi:hypothetical protein [Algibacter aquimarinus]|uniref:Calx-beta domain-containing protein n=1 Tax=Algibacter aquimarinus TaxID=1136748 RepID=A0ABP9H4V1_9FLAO
MKKYIYKLMALLVVFSFASCEEDPVVFDASGGFVQFSSESAAITEDSGDVVSTVILGSGSNPSGVSVDFTITTDDASRFSVSPASGTVEIPAGEFSADITITAIDNFDVDGDVELVINLSTSSSLPVGIGGEGVNFASRAITIIDNDCPLDINAFVGTYMVSEQFTAGQNAPRGLSDFFSESYQVEIALDPNDTSGTKVIITNSAGFNTYIGDGGPVVMSFNSCPGTLTFDAGFPTVGLFRTFEYTASSYSEDSPQVIKCEGPLATFGDYEFVFTKM